MAKNDLKNKGIDELKTIIKESRAKLLKLNFDLAEGRLKNTNELRQLKKMIAGAFTEINAQQAK